jgi:two-component system response regulator MtrA
VDPDSRQGDNPLMNESLLVVEDDASLREVMSIGLEGEGFRVALAEDGPAALLAFSSQAPDLVLLDVMLPGLDGLAVCRELRKVSLAPVIMLTARASTTDVVEGLESGADDYVTKPFDFSELVARIRSVLRRAAVRPVEIEPGTAASVVVLGPLTIDSAAHAVRRGWEEVLLTVTEFRLLYELARNAGRVLSREQLLELVWSYSYLGDSRLVDVHVQRLRAKIEEDPAHPALITTVRGVGYRAARRTSR